MYNEITDNFKKIVTTSNTHLLVVVPRHNIAKIFYSETDKKDCVFCNDSTLKVQYVVGDIKYVTPKDLLRQSNDDDNINLVYVYAGNQLTPKEIRVVYNYMLRHNINQGKMI